MKKFLFIVLLFVLFGLVYVSYSDYNNLYVSSRYYISFLEDSDSSYIIDNPFYVINGSIVNDNGNDDSFYVNTSEPVLVSDTISNNSVSSLSSNYDNGNYIKDIGAWFWPTNSNYMISSYYGYRWGRLHDAIDITGTGYNSPIYASNNGIVYYVGYGCVVGNLNCNGGLGNYVIIKHSNGYFTKYQHLLSVYVSVGASVNGGDVIGTMGNTGYVVPSPNSSNPYMGMHLHYSVFNGDPYNGGESFDPLLLY